VLIVTPESAYPVPGDLDLRSALAVMDDGSTAVALLEAAPVIGRAPTRSPRRRRRTPTSRHAGSSGRASC
jgi:hypothetical protein